MSRCPNHWRGQHRFEPRYDMGPADLSRFNAITGTGAGSFMEKLRSKTYVRDICTRCGETKDCPPADQTGQSAPGADS